MKTLRYHAASQNPKVAQQACLAITNLAKTSSNCAKLGLIGVFDCMLDALKTHPADSDLALYACEAISRLLANEENAAIFWLIGGCEVSGSAIRTDGLID